MQSDKKISRLAAYLYLLLIITGVFSLMYVPNQIFIYGDNDATINNILSSEFLYRLGIIVNLISNICYLYLALTLNNLFKETDEKLSFSLVLIVAMSVAIAFLNMLNEVAALILLKNPEYLSVFNQNQLNAIVSLFLDLYGKGIIINQLFWGLWLIPFGLLVIKSRFFPQFLGYFLVVGGVGSMAGSLTSLMSPEYGNVVLQFGTIPADIGEMGMMLALLITGFRK